VPRVGKGPDSKLPPDLPHLRRALESHRPDVVVALGQQAEQALAGLWAGPLLALPHPASRVLTNTLLDSARGLLCGAEPFRSRVALRQLKEGVLVQPVSTNVSESQ